MSRQKIDLLLVRNDAPVKRMHLRLWPLYLLAALLLLLLVALAGGGYLLWQQNQAFQELVKDNRRFSLAIQNLETMVQDLQDRALIAEMGGHIAPPPPPPPSKAPAPEPKPPASQAKADSKPAKEAPADKEEASGPAPASAQAVEPWPTSADWVEVRDIKQRKSGRDLLVYFDVANKKDAKNPAKGFVTVLLRSERKGAPWVESWPPARLTPLGRPEDPKKGAPFSLHHRKRFRARFALVDKKVEAIDFLVYDQQGDLALLKRESMDSGK